MIKNIVISLLLPILFVGCSDSGSNSSGITSSSALGGEANTMSQCRHKLDQTAKKYNVTYTITLDQRDYFSGKIVKDGVQSDLLVICDKKGDYYQAMFEIPD